MSAYLVEAYVPGTATGGARDVAARAAAAAEGLAGVTLISTLLLPEDETCFLLYEAVSAELLGEAGRRAQFPWQRVQEAILVEAVQAKA
jgi:hypothetical protein